MTINVLANYKVHPSGFSNFELATIETFFRLAARKAPFWSVCAELEDAAVILLNVNDLHDVDAIRSRRIGGKKIVVVGASDFGTGWPVLHRPLRLTSMLTALNALASPTGSAPPAAALPGAVSRSFQSPLMQGGNAPPLAARPLPLRPVSAPAPGAASSAAVLPSPSALSPALPPPSSKQWPLHDVFATPKPPVAIEISSQISAAISPATSAAFAPPVANLPSRFAAAAMSAAPVAQDPKQTVLIVDDSDVALKFMQSRMRVFGYTAQLARSGEEALALIAQKDFQFVFLDVMMAGLDGYQTCRAIKQNRSKQASVPVVVMLTSRGGTIDKIRGSMSGCDAYLTKPLNEQQLGLVLSKHGAATMKAGDHSESKRLPTASTYTTRNSGRSP